MRLQHQRSSKMSFNDFEKHLKGAAATAVVLAATTKLDAQELQQKQRDAEKAKTEQVSEAKPRKKDDGKTINFCDVASVEKIEQDGKTYHLVDDKVVIDPEMLNENKLKREFKKGEKELWENAEEDQIHQDTVSISEVEFAGLYDHDSKNINIPYIENDLKSESNDPKDHLNFEMAKQLGLIDKVEQHNDTESLAFASILSHETQHKTSDKLGIYSPGLSAEQYATLCQYDEVAANIAELKLYTSAYQEKLDSGASKEEALKVFEGTKEFKFYRDALEQGLDPSSKEGKEKMVSGCFDLWNNELVKTSAYKSQLTEFGKSKIDGNSFSALAVGDDKELDKRINKLFNNVAGEDLSQFLPKEKLKNSEEVDLNISFAVRDKIGLDQEDRESLEEQGVSKKDAIKILTGRKSAPKEKNKKDNSSQTNSNNIFKDNSNQR